MINTKHSRSRYFVQQNKQNRNKRQNKLRYQDDDIIIFVISPAIGFEISNSCVFAGSPEPKG